MNFIVVFVLWQSNIGCLFLTVCIYINLVLNLFIVMSGVLINLIPLMVHNIFLTLVDHYSRSTWTFLMKTKSQTRQLIQTFFNMIETQFSTKIKVLRSNNGAEFAMSDFFSFQRDYKLKDLNKMA